VGQSALAAGALRRRASPLMRALTMARALNYRLGEAQSLQALSNVALSIKMIIRRLRNIIARLWIFIRLKGTVKEQPTIRLTSARVTTSWEIIH